MSNKTLRLFLSTIFFLVTLVAAFAGGGFGGRSGGFRGGISSGRSFGGGGFGSRSGGFHAPISNDRAPFAGSSGRVGTGIGERTGSFSHSVAAPSGRTTSTWTADRGNYRIGYRPSIGYSNVYYYGGRDIYMYPGNAYSYYPGGPIMGYYDYYPGYQRSSFWGSLFLWTLVGGGVLVLLIVIGLRSIMRSSRPY